VINGRRLQRDVDSYKAVVPRVLNCIAAEIAQRLGKAIGVRSKLCVR